MCLTALPRRLTHEEDEQGTGKGRHAGLGCLFRLFACEGVGVAGGVGRLTAGEASGSSDDGDSYTVYLKDLKFPVLSVIASI